MVQGSHRLLGTMAASRCPPACRFRLALLAWRRDRIGDGDTLYLLVHQYQGYNTHVSLYVLGRLLYSPDETEERDIIDEDGNWCFQRDDEKPVIQDIVIEIVTGNGPDERIYQMTPIGTRTSEIYHHAFVIDADDDSIRRIS